MNETMKAMMKPLNPNLIRANSEDTKRQQEAIVMDILRNSPYSMRSYEIGQALDLNNFPGYDPDNHRYWNLSPVGKATRIASRVCKRLEAKGEIISTLYQGYRLYSIPVDINGGEN